MKITIDFEHGREHSLNIRQMVLYAYLKDKQARGDNAGGLLVHITAEEIADKLPELCRNGSHNSARVLLASLVSDGVLIDEGRHLYRVMD